MCKAGRNNVIFGDFHHLGDRLGGRKGERESTGLLEAGNDCMREPLFDFPTHIKGNKLRPSDNKCPRESIRYIQEAGSLGGSDNVVIMTRADIVGKTETEDKEPSRDWRRAGWQGMRETGRNHQLNYMTLEEAWKATRKKAESMMKTFVPARIRRTTIGHNR
jgi:hypothetical protein